MRKGEEKKFTTVSIPTPLFQKITERIKGTDFASASSYVTYVLREVVAEESEEEKPKARLVAFGDTDFAANELIEAYRNRDLFVNSVNWLMGDVEAISIRPKLSRASRFQLSSDQFLRIRSLSLFVLPEVIAVIGVFVWWSRRRAAER